MADEKMVKILKEQGVEAWNDWRKQNPKIEPDLSQANFEKANLEGANFGWMDMNKAVLRQASLKEASLVHTNLKGADLTGANLGSIQGEEIQLDNANLEGANLFGASLISATIRRANLRRANLIDSMLTFAELHEADLRGADLSGAYLTNAILHGANLDSCQIGYTNLTNVTLRNVKGLEKVKHDAPSSVGIDTVYNSGGDIPESFLRGCGVPEDFITYMKSLIGKPIEFYSCFISYSSKDQEFAERLHADLQSKGVRCWFAPEDLKIGDKFRSRIEESIRLYDKVMVVLSEHSIRSSWVEEEAEAALEKERQHPGAMVLFPIRLDDAVMETKQAWAASLRRVRHIGEFNNWKNHDRYKKAFDRLLRDLKADSKADSAA